ncbi:hypothetical protein WR25_05896 [Diploscapter pachys]|uniref:SAC3/GANP/THP3 conserved domain-containing protein n=1 Tax=Diploscapter pachys TaxID=2018661 RepID=A0A2A2KES4_9BILA|nr:hypothetical protein WR25_05896 [Diploscapter pachys]
MNRSREPSPMGSSPNRGGGGTTSGIIRKFKKKPMTGSGHSGAGSGTGMSSGTSGTAISANKDEKSLINSLRALQGRHCASEYEKYMLLDERDKIMYKIRTAGGSSLKALKPCLEMCVEKERYVRIVQNRVSVFEKDNDGKCVPSKMVKEYSRSAADQEMPLPHELRSPQLMELTMDYLLQKVMDEMPNNMDAKTQWYDFLWSRTRAIRKEITQQALVDKTAACQYRPEIRSSEPVRLAIQLATCLQNNNYIKFFRLMTQDASYLQCCICHRYFEALRYSAFCIITKGYRQSAFSVQKLKQMFGYDHLDQTISALEFYGFKPNEEEIVEVSRKFFNKPQTDIAMHHYDWIDDKADGKLSGIVYGPEAYRDVVVPTKLVESFNSSNCYVSDPVLQSILKAAGVSATSSMVSSGAMQAATAWSEDANKPSNILGTYGSTMSIPLPPHGQNQPVNIFTSHLKQEKPESETSSSGITIQVKNELTKPKFESASKWGAKNIFGTAISGIQKTKDQPAQVKQESAPIQQPTEKTTSMLKFSGQFSNKPSIFGNAGLGQAPPKKDPPKPLFPSGSSVFSKADPEPSIFKNELPETKSIFGRGLPSTTALNPFKTEPSTSLFAAKPKEEPPPVNPLLEQVKQTVDELTEETINASCNDALKRLISTGIETEMKENLIRKKLESARQITGKLAEETIDRVVYAKLGNLAERELRKEQAKLLDDLSKRILEKTWNDQFMPLLDATTKRIVRKTVVEESKKTNEGLAKFNSKMQRLWLMQFVTHWRKFARTKRRVREERHRAIREFSPRYGNQAFALENYSRESPKQEKPVRKSRNSFEFGDLTMVLKTSMLRRKRNERLARWVANRWILWTRMRIQGRRFYSKVGRHSLDVYLEESQPEDEEESIHVSGIFDNIENQAPSSSFLNETAISRKRRQLGISAIHPDDSFYENFSLPVHSESIFKKPRASNSPAAATKSSYAFKPPKMRSIVPLPFDYTILDPSGNSTQQRLLSPDLMENSMVTEQDVEKASEELEANWSLNETIVRSNRTAKDWGQKLETLEKDKNVQVDEGLIHDSETMFAKNSVLEKKAGNLRSEMEDFSFDLQRTIDERARRESGQDFGNQ